MSYTPFEPSKPIGTDIPPHPNAGKAKAIEHKPEKPLAEIAASIPGNWFERVAVSVGQERDESAKLPRYVPGAE